MQQTEQLEHLQAEVEHLRRGVRDVRYAADAILMALVGKDKMTLWELEAHVEAGLRRDRIGTPLAEVGIGGRTHHWLSSSHWDGQDIQTVEELVSRWPREKVAAMPGIGRKTLEKIDAVIADKGLLRERWTNGAVA